MKIKFLLLLLPFLIVGCESVQPIAENTLPIVVKAPAHRPTVSGLGGWCDFPIGIYTPDFQTAEGVYYLAPTKLIWSGLGMHRPRRGGLFLPLPNSKDKRQAAWLDQEEDSGGLLGAGASSTTRLWRFDQPVPFEIQHL